MIIVELLFKCCHVVLKFNMLQRWGWKKMRLRLDFYWPLCHLPSIVALCLKRALSLTCIQPLDNSRHRYLIHIYYRKPLTSSCTAMCTKYWHWIYCIFKKFIAANCLINTLHVLQFFYSIGMRLKNASLQMRLKVCILNILLNLVCCKAIL